MYIHSLKKRYQIVFGYIGNLFIYFPLILMIPVLFCFWYPEEWGDSLFFLASALVSLAFGFAFKYWLKVKPGTPISVQEGAIIVVFAWVFGIIFSALPFIFAGILDFSQAVFESTSGWTTTGLTLVDVTKIPKIFLVWRSLMQFFGGAGFAIIMMSAIVGPGGFGLYHAEGRVDNLVPNVKSSVRRILIIYFSYALAGVIALRVVGMGWFDAFNHSLTGLATGGFSTRAGSIGEFNSVPIEMVIIILMFLGTTGFGIHYALWKGNFKALSKNGEPKLMGITVLLFTPLLMGSTFGYLFSHASESFRHATFQAVSALTGTGFSTVDFTSWSQRGFFAGLYLLTLLMIFGGDMDSTSGGLKQYRLYALIKLIGVEIKEFFLPRSAVVRTEIWKGENKRYIDSNLVKEILIIFSLYFLTFGVGTAVISFYGYSLADSAFEYASALSTVGLSVGITRPDAPLGIIWAETVGMFLGRLEFLVIVYGITKMIKDAKLALTTERSQRKLKGREAHD